MVRLDVTDKLVRDLVDQVAPLVEDATGWELKTESLGCRVLPKERGYEELLLGRLKGVGVPVDEDARRGWLERLLEYVIEGNALAAYQPATQELLIVRENVDDSNLNGLRVIVAHELVHRGQHVHHGHLFDRVDTILRETIDEMMQDKGTLTGLREMIEQVRPIMTTIESHAYFVQEALRQAHFPNAVIESHFNLATLLMRLFGGVKTSQYTEGIPEIAAAVKQGDVESLYRRFQTED